MGIDANVRAYLDGATAVDGRKPNARYSSFDYCFNYFQAFRESGDTAAVANPKNIQQSCLQLGFYLASWGMLRGSSDLLQRSVRHLMPVVRAIADADTTLWEIDAHDYTEANIERLVEQAEILRRANGSMSDTLVTKVMLGVFGSVPAFDTNVGRGFKRVLGFSRFGPGPHSATSVITTTRTPNCSTTTASRHSSSCPASPRSVCTPEQKSSTWRSSSRECRTLLANQRTCLAYVGETPQLSCPRHSHRLGSLTRRLRSINALRRRECRRHDQAPI